MDSVPEKSAMCIFEYVYFARHDSVLDGCSVYDARIMAGRLLAKNYGVDADIVAGVPDSANVAARGYAE
ncbi:MAG: amidophosphoribosyltransferase, partial [Clostridia bacterium]|nr:amidophosphoribosyltransferase [Clostridia bacterium]